MAPDMPWTQPQQLAAWHVIMSEVVDAGDSHVAPDAQAQKPKAEPQGHSESCCLHNDETTPAHLQYVCPQVVIVEYARVSMWNVDF